MRRKTDDYQYEKNDYYSSDRCSHCQGSGQMDGDSCPSCEGSGSDPGWDDEEDQ